jgi:D-psicose/D-tagatose/L-ribulose 3-epimerase
MTYPINPIGVISMFYARPFTKDHFGTFARMKKAGADVIELLVPEADELDLTETRKAIQDAGLTCVLAARVNLTRDLASPDAQAYQAGIAYLEHCVEIAAALDAKIVGGPLYGAPMVFAGRAPTPVTPEVRKRKIDAIVVGLQRVAKRAADHGVVFGVEPLNRFETDICNTADHAIEIVDRVDHAAVGVMLDTFHMNMEDFDLARAIHKTGKRLVHFQANENNRGFVGSGPINWGAVSRALADIGYEGAIVLEPFRRSDEKAGVTLAQWRAPDTNEDEALTHSINYLKAALYFARHTQ